MLTPHTPRHGCRSAGHENSHNFFDDAQSCRPAVRLPIETRLAVLMVACVLVLEAGISKSYYPQNLCMFLIDKVKYRE